MIRSLFRKIRARFLAGVARTEDLNRLYDQIAGLIQIQNAMAGRPVLRPMRGWAISPDAVAWVLSGVQERGARTVIEFGSGQSTVILAAAMMRRNGRLISVEHDPDYMTVIKSQVAGCGLNDFVEFIHAPLLPDKDTPDARSYDTRHLPETPVDIALIDGPPYTNGCLTRLVPLRWAARHLNKGGVIFFDDSARESERACLKQLSAEFPSLQVQYRQAEKGLVELSFV